MNDGSPSGRRAAGLPRGLLPARGRGPDDVLGELRSPVYDRYMSRGLRVGVPAAIALLVAPASAAATYAGRNGRIVFTTGHWDSGPATSVIATMNPDGTDVRSLGITGARPVWSPDGRRIMYSPPTAQAPGGEQSVSGPNVVRVVTVA